jgi:hypothetical protein
MTSEKTILRELQYIKQLLILQLLTSGVTSAQIRGALKVGALVNPVEVIG